MVSQVTLGSFFKTSSGKTVLGGTGGSGLDTESLIKSLTDAKSLPITQNQDKIDQNAKVASAFSEFKTLLGDFQTAADALRNPPGVGNAGDDAFRFTTGRVLGSGGDYFNITTSPGATLQSYNISAISQLATYATQATGTFTIDSSDESIVSADPIEGTLYQFKPGTITVNGQNITLSEGDSLDAVASQFNAVSDDTGIVATVIQVASGSYQLSFSATDSGADASFDLADVATVSSDASGVLKNIGITQHQYTGTFSVADADTSVTTLAATANRFKAGTVTVNGQNITLSVGDSLNDVAAAFNAAGTGLTAHVLQIAAGQFKMVFTADPGTAAFDLTDAGTTTDPDSVFGTIGLVAPTDAADVTDGEDAEFKLNGITITRSSNTISDVIDGVTFELTDTTPDLVTNYTAVVSADTTTVQNAIVNFVQAYNSVKEFAAKQTEQSSNGTYKDTALLATDPTFRSAMANINAQINSAVSGLSGSVTSLADVGVSLFTQEATADTPEVPNMLNVNDGELAEALATNFSAVRRMFGFTLTSNNPSLTVFSHTHALGVSSFTLTINPGTDTFTATYTPSGGSPTTITLDAEELSGSVDGYMLRGQDGTVLEGLELIYASTANASISVTATQGIADKSYSVTDAITKTGTGTLAVAVQSLQDTDDRLNDDIDRLTIQVEQYQQLLLKQFAALEQAISKVNTLLSSLTANANAALAASGN